MLIRLYKKIIKVIKGKDLLISNKNIKINLDKF